LKITQPVITNEEAVDLSVTTTMTENLNS